MPRPIRTCAVFAILLSLFAITPVIAAGPVFQIRFSPEVREEAFSGRVYLFFSKNARTLSSAPRWVGTEPFVSLDVTRWKPGTPLTITRDTPGLLTFPKNFDGVDLTGYSVLAAARFEPWSRDVTRGAGNAVSRPQPIPNGTDAEPVKLTIDQPIGERPFPETDTLKLFQIRSNKLSEFHNRDVFLKAGVRLPNHALTHPNVRYPVVFVIPGFTGRHYMALGDRMYDFTAADPVPFIVVYLDPDTKLGHHVFADSANNGPYGTAFVEEFLPAFEKKFPVIAESTARFLTGHSSGGWSSLWVQLQHPETFGGVWSTAPDPVDFADFSRIDIEREGENFYVDPAGERRPIGRQNGRVIIWLDDFVRMETVLGHGGQMKSFESVFGPRREDGSVAELWDRDTGEIDLEVAKAWRKYDIRRVVEKNWDTIGPQLAGKIHVHMGTEDNFFLEGATVRLKAAFERVGSDAEVTMHRGKDHFTILTRDLLNQIDREMTEQFRKHHPNVKY